MGVATVIEEYMLIREDFMNKCSKVTSFGYAAVPTSSSWIPRIRILKKFANKKELSWFYLAPFMNSLMRDSGTQQTEA